MTQKKKSCMDQIRSIVKNITVEPSGFFMLFASSFASLASQTLSLDKTCRVNLNLTEDVCDAVRYQNTLNNTENERIVQDYLASQLVWTSALQTALPCLVYPFVGGWLDLTGRRKLFMIIPLIGEALAYISNIINVIFFYQLPVQVGMFFNVFFLNVTGGWSIMFLAVFSYISDITSEKNRTHRLGIVSFFVHVGMPAGSALSGIVLKHYGYYTVYFTSLTIQILNILYLIFFLSDPPRSPEKKKHDGRGIGYSLKTFFNLGHLTQTLRVIFRKTGDNRPLRLIVLMIAVCILFGPMYGEGAILYLSTRYRFNWDEVQFSLFQTYTFMTNTVGTMVTVILFAKIFGWNDSVLGLISCCSKIVAAFVYCFATTGPIFYIAPAVDMFAHTAMLAIRSTFSKQVDPDELGKVNSIVGLFENLMPLAYVSMYTKLYTGTMETLPGAVFLLGAFLTLPSVGVFIWLFVRHRKGLDKPKMEKIDYNENQQKFDEKVIKF